MSARTGKILKAARERAGLTLTDLAAVIGMSSAGLCNLENGKNKTPPSPDEMVALSDALGDRTMLVEYCCGCELRTRIKIRKFTPLNNVIGGSLGANYKLTEKLAVMAEKAPAMMSGILNPNFKQDPESDKFLDDYLLNLFDIMRVAETIVDKLVAEGFRTEERVLILKQAHQAMCERKGYHIGDEV
jgi:transcriptional regulator with XRE-family HTH domain